MSVPNQLKSFSTVPVKLRMPAVDVYGENDDVVMKEEIPGLSEEDISVEITDVPLSIKGEKKREEAMKKDDYSCCERMASKLCCARAVRLPGHLRIS